MKLAKKRLLKRNQMMGVDTGEMPPVLGILAILGLVLFGALAIPTLVGLISAVPDAMRYMKMRSM